MTLFSSQQMIDKLIHLKKVFNVPLPKSNFELVMLGFEMGVQCFSFLSLARKAQNHLLFIKPFPQFLCTTKGRLDTIQKTVIYCSNITKRFELILFKTVVTECEISV